MGLLDIILLIILGGFALFGLWFGLIHALGGLVGTIVGALAAGYYYDTFALWVNAKFGGSLEMEKVILFLAVFIIVNRLVGFVFYIAERVFKVVENLPFIRGIDRILGGVLSFVEGVLVLGLTLYFSGQLPEVGQWLQSAIESSRVAPYLVGVGKVLAPFLPEAIKTLQSWLPWAFR